MGSVPAAQGGNTEIAVSKRKMRLSKRTLEKRRKDRKAQLEYYLKHKFCEICGRQGYHVHEIVFRSHGGKCVEENMISLCLDDYQRAHFLREPYLTREELFEIKKGGKYGNAARRLEKV